MTSLCLLLSFGRDPLCSMHFSLFILSRSLFSVVSRPSLPILTQLLSTRTPPLPPLRRYEQSFTPPSSPHLARTLSSHPLISRCFLLGSAVPPCVVFAQVDTLPLWLYYLLSPCVLLTSPPPSPRSHCPLLYSYPHHVSISRSPYSVFVASVSIFVSYALSRCPALLLSSSLRDVHLHFGLSRRPLAPTACLSV